MGDCFLGIQCSFGEPPTGRFGSFHAVEACRLCRHLQGTCCWHVLHGFSAARVPAGPPPPRTNHKLVTGSRSRIGFLVPATTKQRQQIRVQSSKDWLSFRVRFCEFFAELPRHVVGAPFSLVFPFTQHSRVLFGCPPHSCPEHVPLIQKAVSQNEGIHLQWVAFLLATSNPTMGPLHPKKEVGTQNKRTQACGFPPKHPTV